MKMNNVFPSFNKSVNDIYIIEMHIGLTLSAMSISFSLKVVSIVFKLCSINYNYHVELIFTILFITIYWLCPLFHLQIYYLTISVVDFFQFQYFTNMTQTFFDLFIIISFILSQFVRKKDNYCNEHWIQWNV